MLKGYNNMFLRIFFQPLSAQSESAESSLSESYAEYVKSTNFRFELPEENYLALLNFVELSFHKRSFKKVVAHYVAFCQTEDTEVLQKILNLCKLHNLGETALELGQMIAVKNERQLVILLHCLARYKDHENIVVDILKAYLETNPVKFSLIESYVNEMISKKKNDLFMTVFEKLKIFLLSRKFKADKALSVEELVKQQNDFKVNSQNQIREFYSAFISHLISKSNLK